MVDEEINRLLKVKNKKEKTKDDTLGRNTNSQNRQISPLPIIISPLVEKVVITLICI
jgi:hypothetical protein